VKEAAHDSVGIVYVKGAMMKTALTIAVAGMILITAMAMPAFAASKTNRVSVRYVPPKNPTHQGIYTDLKQRGALEKLQKLLSPVRLPRKLRISLDECDGEADAFYEDDEITICYEYIAELVKNMPQETTPGGVAPIDTIIGPMRRGRSGGSLCLTSIRRVRVTPADRRHCVRLQYGREKD